MVKDTITEAEMKAFQKSGVRVTRPKKRTPPKPEPKLDTSRSSPEMKAAVAVAQRTAEAAVMTAKAVAGFIEESKQSNKKILKAIESNAPLPEDKITGLKIKRGADKLMKEVQLIREND